MSAADYRWSLGTLIGLPLSLLGIVVLVGLTILAWRWKRTADQYDREFAIGSSWGGLVCIVVAVVFLAWGMWPYEAEYHQWQDTSGTVERIDSRLLAGSNGGATERFVVTFDDGRQRACDDTRCSQVEAGDYLTIACKRAWQWSGTHGYDCTYVSHEVTR